MSSDPILSPSFTTSRLFRRSSLSSLSSPPKVAKRISSPKKTTTANTQRASPPKEIPKKNTPAKPIAPPPLADVVPETPTRKSTASARPLSPNGPVGGILSSLLSRYLTMSMVRGALTGDFRECVASKPAQVAAPAKETVPETSPVRNPVASSLLKSPAPKVAKQSPVRPVSDVSESDSDLPLRKSRRLNPPSASVKVAQPVASKKKVKRAPSKAPKKMKRKVTVIARAAPKRSY